MRSWRLCVLVVVAVALGASAAWAWPGCWTDIVSVATHGDTLTVSHADATYNCCIDRIEYSVTQEEGLIDILETEVITNICACLCCYDLGVDVVGLAPGEYQLRLRWHDPDTWQWEEWTSTVIIAGSGTEPFVASVRNSGCLDPASASGGETESSAWGRTKARYR